MRAFILHIVLFITAFFLPCLTINAQEVRTYSVKGGVFNGERLKPLKLKLIDSTGNTIKTVLTDSLGEFKFTALTSGRYRIVNKKYEIDTLFSVPAQAKDALLIEVNVCDVGAGMALKDIKNNRPRLLLIGSIAPLYVRGQEKFEKEFDVSYYDFGDTAPSQQCMINYNKIIFKYLDSKYGNAWRKEVRKDVIGFRQQN